jgi:hypothetical protein
MGQYLAVAIATKMTIHTSTALKRALTPQDVIKTLGGKVDIYDFAETKDAWTWTIKQSVVEAELLPFLETIYANLYGVGSSDYEDVLARLRELPPAEWLTFTENEGFEAFQANDYGESYTLSVPDKSRSTEIEMNEQSIILALEGKISMECYGQLFGFFQTAIQEQFKAFQLGQTLRVFITG